MSEYKDPMNEVLADNLVEVIATMTQEQRDEFVNTFVSKWPKLASQVSFNTVSYTHLTLPTKRIV